MALLDKLLGPPSRQKFAHRMAAALRDAGETGEPQFNEAEFELRFGEGEHQRIVNLTNMYAEHCRVPRSAREDHFRRLVTAMRSHEKEIPDEFEHAKPDLRPVVRSRSYLDFVRLHQGDTGDGPNIPMYDLGNHLAVSLVYDLPEAMVSITQDQLDNWDVTFYEALESARQNLEQDNFTFACIAEMLYASATGDNYDASRLLLLDLIRKLEVDGDPIAMVPNRDTLLLTGSNSTDGLAMMAEIAEKALTEDPRPMCGVPLRLVRDEWETWLPPKDHPLYVKLKTLALQSVGSEYADQKNLLDQLHEKQGIDRFVASFSGIQTDEGDVFSYCVWVDAVGDAYLPKTDKIMFARGEGIVASGTWDRVAEIVGDLLKPLDMHPPRFHVTQFPTDEQLEAIGNDSE